jgi:hypothetical protein
MYIYFLPFLETTKNENNKRDLHGRGVSKAPNCEGEKELA